MKMKQKTINNTIFYFEQVNCNDVKITYYNFSDPFNFENTMYYSLDNNILKYHYRDITENVNIFTSKIRNKLKITSLKMLLKEYSNFNNNTEYIKKQIEKIKSYINIIEKEA